MAEKLWFPDINGGFPYRSYSIYSGEPRKYHKYEQLYIKIRTNRTIIYLLQMLRIVLVRSLEMELFTPLFIFYVVHFYLFNFFFRNLASFRRMYFCTFVRLYDSLFTNTRVTALL